MKPKPTPSPNGARIEDLRWDKRLSVPELASKVGITRQHLKRICKGERGASLDVQQRIAEVLDVPVEDIQQGAP